MTTHHRDSLRNTPPDRLDEGAYLIGIGAHHTHAVPVRRAIAVPGNTSIAARRGAGAVCGAATTVLPDRGAFRLDNPDLARPKGCPVCTWTVALEQDTAAAALDLFAPDPPAAEHVLRRLLPGKPALLRELCAAILADEDDYDRDHPHRAQLLAHATAHAPQILVPEECAENDCDHDRYADGSCSSPDATLSCATCSVRAGSWAGEWEGGYAVECTVTAPCDVLRTLGRHYGVEISH